MKSLTALLLAIIPFSSIAESAGPSPGPDSHDSFNPKPLADAWSGWLVGEWEDAGASETGAGRGVTHYELGLGGQFIVSHGEATITDVSAEQVDYLKRNMHASDEEIARFRAQPYRALECVTVDEKTGEVLGFSFDSLRCIGTGRGRREGNREIMEWRWTNGRTSTRITERLGEDRMRIIQRTPMPDGSVLEEKGESRRRSRTPLPVAGHPEEPADHEPEIVRSEANWVLGTLTHIAPGTESAELFASIWSGFEALRGRVEPHSIDQKYYGVSFAPGADGGADYLAGMAVVRIQAVPAGLVLREVPAATYAVFACPAATIGQTKHRILGQSSSDSGYVIDRAAPVFEQYPPASDTQSPVRIHIPIQPSEAGASDTAEAAATRAFIDAINRHDLAALAALMPDDHAFIDSEGGRTAGRDTMLAAWPRYFAMFPDYRIVVERVVAQGNVVVVLGSWSGTFAGADGPTPERAVGGPAAWSATVRAGKIHVWQVYADHTRTHEVVKRTRD